MIINRKKQYQESCPKCEADDSKLDLKNVYFWLDTETQIIVFCHRCFKEHYQINILNTDETVMVQNKLFKKVRVCLCCLKAQSLQEFDQHYKECLKHYDLL